MQTTSTEPAMVVIAAPDVQDVLVRALIRGGATPADSQIQAEVLLEGELRGHASHGIRRLPVLLGRLKSGAATSGLEPGLRWHSDSALRVDGRRGLGPVVAAKALDALLARAPHTGVAFASIHNAGHVGMLAPYLERIAGNGCAGIALTVSEALVHPWGGATAMVGTNPIGIGVPTLGPPLIVDMSTAQVSAGKILDFAARGEDIPLGWAVDETGGSTTDPVAAAHGALSPFGGPKGYALGLGMEAFVGLLAGSAFGQDVRGTLDTEHAPTKGDIFIVLSVEALEAQGGLAPLTEYLDEVRASATAGHVHVPGDRARAERARRSAEGIPLDAKVWRQAVALSEGIAE